MENTNVLNNALLILQSPLYLIAAAFSKCFPGAGHMNAGGGLGSEGTLSSVLRVRAYSKVLGYPSLEKI